MGFFEKAKELGGTAASKVSGATEMNRINGQIKDVEKQIDWQFREIGRIVYENESGIGDDEDYTVNIAKVDDLNEELVALTERLDRIRNG